MQRSRSVPSCAPVKGRADDESPGRSGERPPRGELGSSRVIRVRETLSEKLGGPGASRRDTRISRRSRETRGTPATTGLFRLWYIHILVRA